MGLLMRAPAPMPAVVATIPPEASCGSPLRQYGAAIQFASMNGVWNSMLDNQIFSGLAVGVLAMVGGVIG